MSDANFAEAVRSALMNEVNEGYYLARVRCPLSVTSLKVTHIRIEVMYERHVISSTALYLGSRRTYNL